MPSKEREEMNPKLRQSERRIEKARTTGISNSDMSQANQITMPEDVKSKMENSFHADFTNVKLFESSDIKQAGAKAVTQGSNIGFAPGEFSPESKTGQELLGHELTHVVQQAKGVTMGGQSDLVNSSHMLESSADLQGERAARGEAVTDSFAQSSVPSMNASMAPIQAKDARKMDKSEKNKRKKEAAQQRAELDSKYGPNTYEGKQGHKAMVDSSNRDIVTDETSQANQSVQNTSAYMEADTQTQSEMMEYQNKDWYAMNSMTLGGNDTESMGTDRADYNQAMKEKGSKSEKDSLQYKIGMRIERNASVLISQAEGEMFDSDIVNNDDLIMRYSMAADMCRQALGVMEWISAYDNLTGTSSASEGPMNTYYTEMRRIVEFSTALGMVLEATEGKDKGRLKDVKNRTFGGKALTYANFKETRGES